MLILRYTRCEKKLIGDRNGKSLIEYFFGAKLEIPTSIVGLLPVFSNSANKNISCIFRLLLKKSRV